MKKVYVTCNLLLLLIGFSSLAIATTVDLYVDAAPNVYGSPDYEPWKTATFSDVAAGTFVNMSNGVNPDNVGTTDFEIQDEVVYSFGDLGKRLTWIYWVEDKTVTELSGEFEVKLENWWDGDYLDFYNDYYGSTWLEPTKWENYDDGTNSGVIGTAGMAWWGAYDTNTQAELDDDIAAWMTAEEEWKFTAKYGGTEYSITSHRDAVPEPTTWLLFGTGLLSLAGFSRKKFFKKS